MEIYTLGKGEHIKVAMLGMNGEFSNIDSTAGIVKYQSHLYSEMSKVPEIHNGKRL